MTLEEFIHAINVREYQKKEVIFALPNGTDLEFLSIYDVGNRVYIDIGEEDE